MPSSPRRFWALRLFKTETGQDARLGDLADDDLMAGDVTVRVESSSLNYKDDLALTGAAPIVRTRPLTPGIDLGGWWNNRLTRGSRKETAIRSSVLRRTAWSRVVRDLDLDTLETMSRTVTLAQAAGLGAAVVAGQVRGRIVVDVNA